MHASVSCTAGRSLQTSRAMLWTDCLAAYTLHIYSRCIRRLHQTDCCMVMVIIFITIVTAVCPLRKSIRNVFNVLTGTAACRAPPPGAPPGMHFPMPYPGSGPPPGGPPRPLQPPPHAMVCAEQHLTDCNMRYAQERLMRHTQLYMSKHCRAFNMHYDLSCHQFESFGLLLHQEGVLRSTQPVDKIA